MIKAQQGSLIQNTNIQVIDIRSMELDYYNKVFTNFSTLCALISGFVLTCLTNTDLTQFTRNTGSRIAGDAFFVLSAAAIAFSTYCLQQTVLCNVYALGLALRGPLGSMVIAVDGIINEQYGIVLSFVLTIVSFALATIAYFWVVETTIIASFSTCIMLIGMLYWYYYCTRIINRFQWTDERIVWDVDDDEDRAMHQHAPSSSAAVEGYLNKKDISLTKDQEDPWMRKYFVLDGAYLFYYENKQAANQSRDKPVNFRPILLPGYDVRSTRTAPFSIRLTPQDSEDDRRVWDFRCDTAEESNVWTEAFNFASTISIM